MGNHRRYPLQRKSKPPTAGKLINSRQLARHFSHRSSICRTPECLLALCLPECVRRPSKLALFSSSKRDNQFLLRQPLPQEGRRLGSVGGTCMALLALSALRPKRILDPRIASSGLSHKEVCAHFNSNAHILPGHRCFLLFAPRKRSLGLRSSLGLLDPRQHALATR